MRAWKMGQVAMDLTLTPDAAWWGGRAEPPENLTASALRKLGQPV